MANDTEAVASGSADHAFVQRFRLVVVEGPDAGTTYNSQGERMTIGRHASAELVLSDKSASQFHCEIAIANGRAVVRDLDSRNGTTLDGVTIKEAYPGSGSMLALGRTRIRFELAGEPVPVPISAGNRFGRMVGGSAAIRAVFSVLERAAASDATVLLEGETGTGKEAAADSIHAASTRRDQPFVVVDCGAIPPTLLESELFGHERGAFTGAVAQRPGMFEIASGGTLFLDEIGELAPDLQPKLLRALESKEVRRVGANQYIPVDCRVIAATCRSLRADVNVQKFRADLFYRIAVVQVRLPPLRERLDDLPQLVEAFAADLGSDLLRAPELLAHLQRHSWPGNVRELRNYLERCVALGEVAPLAAESAPRTEPSVDPQKPLRQQREQWITQFERRYLEELLALHDGNVSAAARGAGMDRPSFYRLLWKHGLR